MRFKPLPHTISRRMRDELILVNVSTNRMFAGNESAAEIWAALVNGEDIAALKEHLLATTNIPESPADVDAFVDMLVREGLVEPA